ncbi:MAG: hypothetical protein JWQ09_4498 [Segetibacter sp.]|nr:hypothetical protein [Segetibacter sp.]
MDKGHKNLDFLKNVVTYVKDSFYIRGTLLKAFNEEEQIRDAPLVVLSLYEIDKNHQARTISFIYAGIPK